MGWEVLLQYLYSSDLALGGFLLFGSLKGGQKFEQYEQARRASAVSCGGFETFYVTGFTRLVHGG
jgi:hypothetical protein